MMTAVRAAGRAFKSSVGLNAIGGAVAGAVGVVVTETIQEWRTPLPDKESGEIEKEAWEMLFGESALPDLYPGAGNPLGLLDNGTQKLSYYLENSACYFSDYIAEVYGLEKKPCKNNLDGFEYDPFRAALFLGGPVANNVTKAILGYTDVGVLRNGKSIVMPTPVRKSKTIRWAQLHGEDGYGIYNGKLEVAKRYDDGKLVERAVYKLIDKNDRSIITPRVDKDGFLENEWLTIVKLKYHDYTTVIIGGMHGYSTHAFSREITQNIESLKRITNNYELYQVIVPVNLVHEENLIGRLETVGELDWNSAKVQELSA